MEEARKLGHNYIGTEHLLLGVIRQADGVAIDVLRQLGLTSDAIRRRVLEEIQQDPATGEAASEAKANVEPVDKAWVYAVEALMQRLGALDAGQIARLVEYAEFLRWQADQQSKSR